MRMISGVFVISGLAALSGSALAQHDLLIAVPGLVLVALWALAIALRLPKAVHTGCLGLTAVLCALSTPTGMPGIVPVLCLSAALYGWDLALMELRLSSYPHEARFLLNRRYSIRCLILIGVGFAVALLVRLVHVRLSFFSAFVVSSLCAILFLVIHRRVRALMVERSSARPVHLASAMPDSSGSAILGATSTMPKNASTKKKRTA